MLSLKHLTLQLFHLMSPLFTYANNLIQLKRVFFLFDRALSRRKEVYLGDDNSLTLIFNARNEGEGGAYEAELHVVLPPEADYSGIARNNEVRGNTTRLAENVKLSKTNMTDLLPRALPS